MLLELGLVCLTAAHFVAVNLAAAAPLVCLWLFHRQSRRHDAAAGLGGRWLLSLSIAGLLVGALLGSAGLALLHWLDRGAFLAAAQVLPVSRYAFAVLEILFSLACYAGAWQCWVRADRQPASRRRGIAGAALVLLGSTNLLYHFPTLFAAVAVISEQPARFPPGTSFLAMLAEPEVLARSLHFALAAWATSGMALVWLAWRMTKTTAPATAVDAASDDASRLAIWGARLALVPTLLQWIVGAWLLVAIPAVARDALLGASPAAAGCFLASLALSVVLMHRLAGLSFGESSRSGLAATLALFLLVILLMVGVRQQVRRAAASAIAPPAAAPR